MTRVLRFDEKVEIHLNEIMNRLRLLGIEPVSRSMALRVMIEMNKEAQIKLRRKRKSRFAAILR